MFSNTSYVFSLAAEYDPYLLTPKKMIINLHYVESDISLILVHFKSSFKT